MLQDIHSSLHAPARFGLPADREAESAMRAVAASRREEPRIPAEIGPYALPVVVNHGRWVVECPCGGAQLASRTDRRFLCVDCRNVLFGGKWVAVEWPERAAALEAELMRRPLAPMRNWRPDEPMEAVQELTTEALREAEQLVEGFRR